MIASPESPERISIDVTNRCEKGCDFCYNLSQQYASDHWEPQELIAFVKDCAVHGTKAVSFGGGEPLLFSGIEDVIGSLKNTVFRSLTTSGLPLLDHARFQRLVEADPDKIQFSIHNPYDLQEVDRVIGQSLQVQSYGVRIGFNLLVSSDNVLAIRRLSNRLLKLGFTSRQLTFVPRRYSLEPDARQVAVAAGFFPFQSSGCLTGCRPVSRFCSISFDKRTHWCSFSHHKQPMESIDHKGLISALSKTGPLNCQI